MNAPLWWLLSILPVAAPWQGVGEANRFSVQLPVAASAWERAEVSQRGGRLTVFVPEARLASYERSFAEGPVSRMRSSSNHRGTWVVLTSRGGTDLRAQLQLTRAPGPGLHVGPPGAPTALLPAGGNDAESVLPAERGGGEDGAPPPAEAQAQAGADKPARRPGAESPPPPGGHAWPAEVGSATPDSSRAWAVLIGVSLLTVAGFALRPQLRRRFAGLGGAAQGGLPGEEIRLLATRALSGRHRLALVETCGERLLLATTDRDVTLLSHMPGAPLGEPEPPERGNKAQGQPGNLSEDVAGLLQMAQRQRDTRS